MAVVAIDFETFYDPADKYSLSVQREVDYILDARFETIMCAVKEGRDGDNQAFVGHEAVAYRFRHIDWGRAALLSHNMRFDGAIALWHYGRAPKLYLDTLSMARALTHAVTGKSSLKAVAEYLGLGAKTDEVVRAAGKRLADFTPWELNEYIKYCLNDNALCFDIFLRFQERFPKRELPVVDLVQRMFITPQVTLNEGKLLAHLGAVRARQAAIMANVNGIDRSVFSSNIKFKALLESNGVEVPMKLSPTTGEMIPAIAKNDRAFKELCSDPDQPLEVQAILAARLGVKSTIEETRTIAMLELAQRVWPDGVKGWAPIPLKFSGAHTHRLSGDGGYNWQNVQRDSMIKEAAEAPPGYRIVHRDYSQIEARMVAWMARCNTLLIAFEEGRDVYSEFISGVLGRTITKADKKERFAGKVSVLQLMYQTAAEKLRHTLFIGNSGMSLDLDIEACKKIVTHYRRVAYPEIPAYWAANDDVLEWMIQYGKAFDGSQNSRINRNSTFKAPIASLRGVVPGRDCLWLPNGLCIAYPDIRHETVRMPDGKSQKARIYRGPYGMRTIYGGKATENESQALSRIVVTETAVRVKEHTGYEPWLSTHDSLDYCVPEREAAAFDEYLETECAVRLDWCPDLPLASEGGWGVTWRDAERAVNQ